MTYVISIGSNEDREKNLSLAHTELQKYFPDIRYSTIKETLPIRLANPQHFLNQIAKFHSDWSRDAIIQKLKQIEMLSGRTTSERNREIVRLDLDLLMQDDCRLRELDLQRPYVMQGMKELMPDRLTQPSVVNSFRLAVAQPLRTEVAGMPLYVIEDSDVDIIRIDFLICGGPLRQDCPLQAKLTLEMLRQGTTHYSSSQIETLLDYYGARLEQVCMMSYSVLTLYTQGKYLNKTLPIVLEMLGEATFPEKEFLTCKEKLMQQFLVNMTKVKFVSQRELVYGLFGETHPFGYRLTEADYQRISTSDLHRFYDKFYHPENAQVYVSGHVPASLVAEIEQMISHARFAIRKGEIAKTMICPAAERAGQRLFMPVEHTVQSSVNMGFLTIPKSHEDYLKLMFTSTLLGGFFGSRLMSNIREKKGYTYGIGAGLVAYPDCSLFLISSETAHEHVEPLIAEVYREMEKLQQELVPESELQLVKNFIIGEYCRTYESFLSFNDAWIMVNTARLGEDYFQTLPDRIASITSSDVLSVAQRYFIHQNFMEVVAGLQ